MFCGLFDRLTLPCAKRPQTSRPIIEFETTRRNPVTCPKISDENDEVQLHYFTCSCKEPVHCRTLSRAPVSESATSDDLFQTETDAYVQTAIFNIPATEKRLQEIKSYQETDESCLLVKKYCSEGWPNRLDIPDHSKAFYSVRNELSVQGGFLMRGSRLIIPTSMRADILTKLHDSQMQGPSKGISMVARTLNRVRRVSEEMS